MAVLFNNAIFRLILLCIMVSAVAVLLEYLICKFTKKKRIAYIFPILVLAIATAMLIGAKLAPLQGMMDLALIVLSIPLFLSSIVTFLFAFLYKKRK